jgi:hypothetical protein
MTRVTKRLILPIMAALLCAALVAADKEDVFKADPASSYASKQTNEGVTIAAIAYDTEDMTKAPFGKVNPNKEGVLPVLIVIHNGTKESLALDRMRVEYVEPGGDHVDATPAEDLPYLSGPSRPKPSYGPLPTGLPRVGKKKGPLASAQIAVRAFAVKMLTPGEEASGFVYFQTGHRRGSRIYLTGMREARTGKEIFYFEIPLNAH